jgi:hypothetical protein
VSDAWTSAPSVAAWAALLVLIGLIAADAAVSRAHPVSPQISRASGRLLERVEWLMQAGLLLALVPGAIALFSGGPWQAVLWWWLLGFSALMVVFLTVGSVIGLARRWPSWRREIQPYERRAVLGVIALMLASVLVMPAALLVLSALGVQAMTAIPISLALGYIVWHLAHVITQTAPSLSQAAG